MILEVIFRQKYVSIIVFVCDDVNYTCNFLEVFPLCMSSSLFGIFWIVT